jgi:hypothetical protein
MKKRIWLMLALAIPLYPLLTWLVLTYYQDDPSKMIWNDREAYNHKYISQLDTQSGLTQQQLIEKLGGPDITEAGMVGSNTYQLMYYRTKRDISDGITTKQECTALLFKNQQLIALAEQAVQQYQQATGNNA